MSEFKAFEKAWRGKDKTVGQAIKKLFGREKPLKYKLGTAFYKIDSMIRRLEVYLERLKARDKELFERIVDAIISKDEARANMLANEVAEIRKIAKTLFTVQVALEHIRLRIESIREVGEIVSFLGPVVGVVKEVRSAIKSVMPTLGIELSEIQDILQETVLEAGALVGTGVMSIPSSPEAKKILEEAKVVAEQRMKETFPSLPSLPAATQQESSSVEAH